MSERAYKDKEDDDDGDAFLAGWPMAVALGAGIGLILGLLIGMAFDNPALGIAFGMPFGVAFAVPFALLFGKAQLNQDDDADRKRD
ncbi:MAG: hypothetical protein AAFX09_04675 [Pseudomonadota bacterium]